jgi:transglutaminase-like putative cysteine protease
MAEQAAELRTAQRAIHSSPGRRRLILLLAYVQIGLFAVAISEAGWSPKGAWVVLCILTATASGTLLAISRFTGLAAAVYSLMLSLAGAAAVTTPLIPAIKLIPTLGYYRYIELLNWRVLAFITQIPAWVQSILDPTSTLPAKAAQFLLAVAVWNLVTLLLWWTLRRMQALIGLLPAGLLTALAIYRQSGKLDMLAAFFFCGLMLIAVSAHHRRLNGWDEQHISYPYESSEWPLSVILIGAAIILAARIIPIAATPQGRQSLVDLFQPPPQATPMPAETFNPGPILQPSTPAVTLWMGIDSLLEIGAPPTSLDNTVLWVQINKLGTSQESAPYYLRGQIFTSYTGRGWIPPEEEPYPSAAPPILASARQESLQQKIEILAKHADILFAVNSPVLAGDGTNLVFTHPDSSALLRGSLDRYEVTSSVTHPDASQLEDSGTQYPPGLLQTYLQLPADLPPRIGDLAERVTAGAKTPFEKALRIQDYLRTSYPYSLGTPAAPPGQDVVDYFLFDARGGFCSYYASAMTVMLRLQGVPARIVTGFAASEYIRERGALRVPASAAHAWVEVYFPGYGWIEFEPTSSQPARLYPEEETDVSPAGAPSRTGAARQWLDRALSTLLSNRVLQIILLSLLALSAGLVLLRILRFLKPWWLPSLEPQVLYWQMRHYLEQIGVSSTASTTPQEFLFSAGKSLVGQATRLRESIQLTTHNYVLLTFSPHPPSQTAFQEARHKWRRAFPEWLILWIRFWLKRVWRGGKARLETLIAGRKQAHSI